MYQSSEGIILHATPFRDIDTVFTLFTPHGKLGLFKKGGRNQIAPLTLVEAEYFVGKGELYTCRQLTTLNHHLSLRQNLETLECACEMAKAVRAVIVAEQDYTPLYHNFLKCLKELPKAPSPEAIVHWFYQQILEHEGLGQSDEANIKEYFYKLIS